MPRKQREDLTPEVREKVVKDYLAGEKTLVIQQEYKISPGEMYRTLHRAGIILREKAHSDYLQLKEGISIKWDTLRNMLKELVLKTENITMDETFVLVGKVLAVQLEKEPKSTIVELGYLDKAFTPEQLVNRAFELYIEATLESYPDQFEKIGDDMWRAKEKLSV